MSILAEALCSIVVNFKRGAITSLIIFERIFGFVVYVSYKMNRVGSMWAASITLVRVHHSWIHVNVS